MTAKKKENNRLSPTKYLELERASLDIKHEYFNGELFAMVGARKNHVRINANLTGELRNSFKKNSPPCEVWPSDMRVKIETGYVYPDIAISCEDPEFEDNEFDTLTNPIVIIEILSESTEAFDRGGKFDFYQNIPTLKEYILISQDKYRIEQYVRQEQKDTWKYRSLKHIDQALRIESANCEIPLAEIYLNVKFEDQ